MSKRILVVEDQPDNRQIIANCVEITCPRSIPRRSDDSRA